MLKCPMSISDNYTNLKLVRKPTEKGNKNKIFYQFTLIGFLDLSIIIGKGK